MKSALAGAVLGVSAALVFVVAVAWMESAGWLWGPLTVLGALVAALAVVRWLGE